MGKASRSKRDRTASDRKAKSSSRRVREYFSSVGVWNDTKLMKTSLRSLNGEEFLEDWTQRYVDRAQSHLEPPPSIYDLVYRNLDTYLATATVQYSCHEAILKFFAECELPEGEMLDLGCGGGLITCFLAKMRPSVRVVGVDADANAVECASALAEKLGVENCEFICADLETLALGDGFAVVNSNLVLHEVERFYEIGEPFLDGFSTLARARSAFTSPPSNLAATAARHLAADGV